MAIVIPCCSSGEAHDTLRRIEGFVADAAYEAECLRAGSGLGVVTDLQADHARELRAAALTLAGILEGVLGAPSLSSQRDAA